jgi:hypothetical protein
LTYSNIRIDLSTLTLQNLDIDGAYDFLSRIVLSNMSTSWETYDSLPRYLATRVDIKFGPIRISNTALQSRTVYKLIEEASFTRSGKGMVQMCVCFEEVIQEIEPKSPTPVTPSPLPYRTTKPRGKLFVIKKESQTKLKKMKAPAQGRDNNIVRLSPPLQPSKTKKLSYSTRKRAISQVSSPQTIKTPPTTEKTILDTEVVSYDSNLSEDSDNLSDLTLPGTDNSSYVSSSYNLRSKR